MSKVKKTKDPVAEFEKMVAKRSKKMASFSDQYMEMVEDSELAFSEDLRGIVESGDIMGNLGRIR